MSLLDRNSFLIVTSYSNFLWITFPIEEQYILFTQILNCIIKRPFLLLRVGLLMTIFSSVLFFFIVYWPKWIKQSSDDLPCRIHWGGVGSGQVYHIFPVRPTTAAGAARLYAVKHAGFLTLLGSTQGNTPVLFSPRFYAVKHAGSF